MSLRCPKFDINFVTRNRLCINNIFTLVALNQYRVDKLDDIIKGCKSGSREMQGKLYRMYASRLFGICMYYSKDQTEAEDILHDGFMKIFRHIGQYEGKGSFEGWMKRIMINTALEKLRKQNILIPVGDIYEFREEISEETLLPDISEKDLLKLIRSLTPQYRLVFNLFVIEGYSHKEISEMLHISVGTSKSNLARARMALQDKLKKEYSIEKSNKKWIING